MSDFRVIFWEQTLYYKLGILLDVIEEKLDTDSP